MIRRRRHRNPTGGDPLRFPVEAYNRVDTEVAALLSDDPAVAISISGWPQYGAAALAGVDNRLPVALFEPRTAVAMTMPDGTAAEVQVEMIIQAGFTRWRHAATFDLLPEWTVRQTSDGLELWDHGGIWARGSVTLDSRWLAEAYRHGTVFAVYGVQLRVRPPVKGYRRPEDRAAELRRARAAGAVAGAIVAWQDLPAPAEAPYAGPSYEPGTGRFQVAVGADGVTSSWRLNEPGKGVCHGLVLGGPGSGKTNVLRVITAEALLSGRFVVWLADPLDRHNLATLWGAAADRIATSVADTVEMLKATTEIIERRRTIGGYTDPSAEQPGLLILIDEGQEIFAGSADATRLAEHVVNDGGKQGVGLIVSARGADLAYFGGSKQLRDWLAPVNCNLLGRDALDMLNKIKHE
jgi:hypothetical protein